MNRVTSACLNADVTMYLIRMDQVCQPCVCRIHFASFMWGHLIGTALFAGFALFHGDDMMIVGALVIVFGFRIYEARYQSRWSPHWRSIIDKFENAVSDGEQNGGASDEDAMT